MLDAAEMVKVGRFLPTVDELAAHFEVSRSTVKRALRRDGKLREALSTGKAVGTSKLSRAQQLLAGGYWRCKKCRRPLEDANGKCERHASSEVIFVPPNPIMLIWLGKQHLGQADRSFIDSHFKGDLQNATDEQVVKELLPQALHALGIAVPAELEDNKVDDAERERDDE